MIPQAEVVRVVVALAVLADVHGVDGSRRRSRLGNLAGSVSNRVLEEVDPDVIAQRIDVDGLVQRVDVDGLLARVDVDGLLARVDVDALLARVDVDGLLDGVDVDRLLDRVDVDRLLDRVDVDRLLARVDVDGLLDGVDVDRLLDRVDVDRLLARVDVDGLLDGVDVDRLLNRVDVDRLMERVDVDGLVRRAGLPELIADSTGQVAGSALDLARRQLVGIDVGLVRVVQRLLRRDPAALPPGPSTLVADRRAELHAPELTDSVARARLEVSGFYAGPVSRLLAFAGDVALATVTFTFSAAVLSWLLSTVVGFSFETTDQTGPLWGAAIATWHFSYWFVSAAVAGRTPGMLVVGLTIVARDGTPLRPRRALLRTLVMPISVALLAVGAAGLVLDRERRSVHDLLSGTTVVYDWGGRPAELPTPISRWITDHGG